MANPLHEPGPTDRTCGDCVALDGSGARRLSLQASRRAADRWGQLDLCPSRRNWTACAAVHVVARPITRSRSARGPFVNNIPTASFASMDDGMYVEATDLWLPGACARSALRGLCRPTQDLSGLRAGSANCGRPGSPKIPPSSRGEDHRVGRLSCFRRSREDHLEELLANAGFDHAVPERGALDGGRADGAGSRDLEPRRPLPKPGIVLAGALETPTNLAHSLLDHAVEITLIDAVGMQTRGLRTASGDARPPCRSSTPAAVTVSRGTGEPDGRAVWRPGRELDDAAGQPCADEAHLLGNTRPRLMATRRPSWKVTNSSSGCPSHARACSI